MEFIKNNERRGQGFKFEGNIITGNLDITFLNEENKKVEK